MARAWLTLGAKLKQRIGINCLRVSLKSDSLQWKTQTNWVSWYWTKISDLKLILQLKTRKGLRSEARKRWRCQALMNSSSKFKILKSGLRTRLMLTLTTKT